MKYKAFKEKFEKLGTDSKYQGLGKEKYYELLAGKEVEIKKEVADKLKDYLEKVSKLKKKKEEKKQEVDSVDFLNDRKDRGM
ncbi:MAG: hypothetical protein H8D94_01925 [Candidatus Pelagibacter sp.]|nr:hypothetical protein [Candidatus Pelagibacter sp.]